MDIVTGLPIYGTDAVAGVVNIVPYTSYDGFKVEMYEEGTAEAVPQGGDLLSRRHQHR